MFVFGVVLSMLSLIIMAIIEYRIANMYGYMLESYTYAEKVILLKVLEKCDIEVNKIREFRRMLIAKDNIHDLF